MVIAAGGARLAYWSGAAILVVDVVVAAGAPLWNYFFKRFDIPLQSGAAVIAVATFLGVWLLQRSAAAGRQDRNSMRDGIAAAFVVTYLVIVGWATFYGFYSGSTTENLNPLGQTLIGNFTVLTGVVVGGYFGADALKQVTQIRAAQGRQQAAPNHGGDGTADARE